MAVISATVLSVRTIRSDHSDALQIAEILFDVSGTYAQADNAKIASANVAIQDSRRNGKTVTLRDAMLGQTASKSTDNSVVTLKTVAVSTNDITFELATSDYSTEHADATAVTSQNRPYSVLVAFTEA